MRPNIVKNVPAKREQVTEEIVLFDDITLFKDKDGKFDRLLTMETFDEAMDMHLVSPVKPVTDQKGYRMYHKRVKRGEEPISGKFTVYGDSLFKIELHMLGYPDEIKNRSFRRLVHAIRCNVKVENSQKRTTVLVPLAEDEKKVFFYIRDELANVDKNINAHRALWHDESIIHYTFYDEELIKVFGLSLDRVNVIIEKFNTLGLTTEMYLQTGAPAVSP